MIFSSISYKKSKNIIIDETDYRHYTYTSLYRLHHWYIFFVLTIINVLFIDYNTNKYFYVFANFLSGLSFGCYISGALIYGYGKIIEPGKVECNDKRNNKIAKKN